MRIQRPGQKILTIGSSLQVSSPRGGATGLVILDRFADVDGTAIADHTPDKAPAASAWSNLLSTGSIYSNRLEFATDGASVINAGVSDYTITANITAYRAADRHARLAKIIFRHNIVNGTNWRLVLRVSSLSLTKDGGVSYIAQTAVTGISELDVVELKVICNGTSIKGYVNDAFEVSVTDTDYQTDTYVGVGCFRNYFHQYYVDNFKVVQES